MKVKETLAKHKELIIYLALGIYVAGVLWFTLFDREPAYKFRVLAPFWSYGKILEGDFESLKENLENIVLFIPAGYFLRMFLQKNWKKTVSIGFLISLGIELIQLITTLGSFEPDDLLHNSLGTMIGWDLCKWIPIKATFDFKKIKKLSIATISCTLIVLISFVKLSDYFNYQRMVPYAALSNTAEHKNLLVLNGEDGYVQNTDVHIVYQSDGSLKISGTSDKRSWFTLAKIRLNAGSYSFEGLSGVSQNTVALELEYFDSSSHQYIQLGSDVGPVDKISFFLKQPTKIHVYVEVYDGCDCDVTARPVIYEEE